MQSLLILVNPPTFGTFTRGKSDESRQTATVSANQKANDQLSSVTKLNDSFNTDSESTLTDAYLTTADPEDVKPIVDSLSFTSVSQKAPLITASTYQPPPVTELNDTDFSSTITDAYLKTEDVKLSTDLSSFTSNWSSNRKGRLKRKPIEPSPPTIKKACTKPSTIILSSSPSKPYDFWIKELNLFPCDQHVVSSPVQWLNDNIINAVQKLLDVTTGSSMKGFQSTQLGWKCAFHAIEPGHQFIQILHVDSTHWITVSNVNCNKNEIVVYDSRFAGLSLKTKLQICSLIREFTLTNLKFKIANMQQQNDSCSCGLFAVAVATELSHGFDPIVCRWRASVMRTHLKQCLENRIMILFPKDDRRVRGKKYIKTIEEEIYCECREVNDTKRGMISCSNCKLWYHLDYENRSKHPN